MPPTKIDPSALEDAGFGVEPTWVERLVLTNFRNYMQLSLEATDQLVVLFGANGAGKTNLLEAVSLGSGARVAPRSICRPREPQRWPGLGSVCAASRRRRCS